MPNPDNPTHDPNLQPDPEPNFEVPVEVTQPAGIYDRQASLELYTGSSVALIGCGGVGVWVALSLALAGVEHIDLYDGDTLSIHNLNRYPLPGGFVGELKSAALAQWLSLLRPEGRFNPRGEFDPNLHSPNHREWVICATDSLKSRKMAFEQSRQWGAYYLEVGADGEGWSLSPKPPDFSTELEEVAGYQVIPVHVGPCMMAGAAAAYYVLHGAMPTDSISARWNGQRLSVSMMPEEDYPTFECDFCEWREARDGGMINMIKHVRSVHRPEMGLVEAKHLVAGWLPKIGIDIEAPPEAEGRVYMTEVATMTREQVTELYPREANGNEQA